MKKILFTIALTLTSTIAAAIPITGDIGFGGGAAVDNTNFTDSTTVTMTNAKVKGVVTGDFAAEGIFANDTAVWSPIDYSTLAPVSSLWTVGTFTFNLDSFIVDFIANDFLAMTGTGTVTSSMAGLDAATGDWSYTANSAGSNMTWSSSSAFGGAGTSSVPEPAIVGLLGLGLLLVGFRKHYGA